MNRVEVTVSIPVADFPTTEDVESVLARVLIALQNDGTINREYPDTLIGLVAEGVPYTPWQTHRSAFRTRARRHACASA